jgi:hypothetical protein
MEMLCAKKFQLVVGRGITMKWFATISLGLDDYPKMP